MAPVDEEEETASYEYGGKERKGGRLAELQRLVHLAFISFSAAQLSLVHKLHKLHNTHHLLGNKSTDIRSSRRTY